MRRPLTMRGPPYFFTAEARLYKQWRRKKNLLALVDFCDDLGQLELLTAPQELPLN